MDFIKQINDKMNLNSLNFVQEIYKKFFNYETPDSLSDILKTTQSIKNTEELKKGDMILLNGSLVAIYCGDEHRNFLTLGNAGVKVYKLNEYWSKRFVVGLRFKDLNKVE